MKSDEFTADLPEGCSIGLSERLLLFHLADRLHEAYLSRGLKVIDIMDVAEFLREIAKSRQRRPPRSVLCVDCRHQHEGRSQCGVHLGELKFCQCESKVTA